MTMPGPDILAAHRLLARLSLRADEPSAALAARVLEAFARDNSIAPALAHSDAERIGQELASKWALLVGTGAPAGDDLVWADLVQFVLHEARTLASERAQGERP